MNNSIAHTDMKTGGHDLRNGGQPSLPELIAAIDHEIAEVLKLQPATNPHPDRAEEQKSLGRHICVNLAGQHLALSLSTILEAGELQGVEELPLLPDWLRGITNIRGEIISVVDLGLFLGIKDKKSRTGEPFLIVRDGETKTALIVDKILGTRPLYQAATKNGNLDDHTDEAGEYHSGLATYKEGEGEKTITLFNINALISSARFRELKK